MKLNNNKNKTFILRYDPRFSPKQMFKEFGEAVQGKKSIQPENVMMANDLSVIHRIISKARLRILACIKEYQPASVSQLARLLHRDHTNVWRDCQVLANCGIIEMREKGGKGGETQPIALYEQIILDFPPTRSLSEAGEKQVYANC